jgi:hypothetical protein
MKKSTQTSMLRILPKYPIKLGPANSSVSRCLDFAAIWT